MGVDNREKKNIKMFFRWTLALNVPFSLGSFFSCQCLMYLILLNDRQNRFNIVFWFVQIFAERAYKRKLTNAWKFIESLHIIHMYTMARKRERESGEGRLRGGGGGWEKAGWWNSSAEKKSFRCVKFVLLWKGWKIAYTLELINSATQLD